MPEQNTPGAAGQGDGAGAEEFDYRQGYERLRPEYTRTTQELAQVRDAVSEYESLFEALHDSDPEVQRAAFDALGLDLADAGSQGQQQGDSQDDFIDPLEQELAQLREQVSELTSARELDARNREDQEIIQLRDEFIGAAISDIEAQLTEQSGSKFAFTPREEEILGNLAIAMENEQGLPDVQGAYEALYGDQGVAETHFSRRIEQKQQAHQAPFGRTPSGIVKPKTAAERIQFIDQRMADIENQQ